MFLKISLCSKRVHFGSKLLENKTSSEKEFVMQNLIKRNKTISVCQKTKRGAQESWVKRRRCSWAGKVLEARTVNWFSVRITKCFHAEYFLKGPVSLVS